MLKQILPYFLLLCMAILLFFLFQSNRELAKLRLLDNRRMQEVVEAKQAEIDTAAGRILKLKAKVGKDSLKFLSDSRALKEANSKLTRRIAVLRPLIAPQIAENDTLEAFINATDSLLAGKDSLLRDTELFCQLQVRDLSKIIELQEQKFEAQKQITAAVTEQLAKETREHRKTKRRSALKSVGLGILTGGIIYISIRE